MQQFQITLKNEKTRQYDRIALFIILINLVIFIYLAISTGGSQIRITSVIGIVLIIAALSIDYYLNPIKNNEGTSYYKFVAEFIVSMTWLQLNLWIAGLCFLLGTLYLISKRPMLVSVLKDKIIYPSFPKKTIAWSELNGVIIKDGLLTMDLKSNKLIQQVVDENKTKLDEKEFNDFCKQQLSQIN